MFGAAISRAHLLTVSLPECITNESREFIDFVLKTAFILRELTFYCLSFRQ